MRARMESVCSGGGPDQKIGIRMSAAMATAWPTNEPWTQTALRALVGLETTRSLKRLSAGSAGAAGSGGRPARGAGDNARPVMSAILPPGLYRPCDAGCPRQVPYRAPARLPRCYQASPLPGYNAARAAGRRSFLRLCHHTTMGLAM